MSFGKLGVYLLALTLLSCIHNLIFNSDETFCPPLKFEHMAVTLESLSLLRNQYVDVPKTQHIGFFLKIFITVRTPDKFCCTYFSPSYETQSALPYCGYFCSYLVSPWV